MLNVWCTAQHMHYKIVKLLSNRKCLLILIGNRFGPHFKLCTKNKMPYNIKWSRFCPRLKSEIINDISGTQMVAVVFGASLRKVFGNVFLEIPVLFFWLFEIARLAGQLRCTGVLVYWCAGVLVCWCAGVLVYWRTSVVS